MLTPPPPHTPNLPSHVPWPPSYPCYPSHTRLQRVNVEGKWLLLLSPASHPGLHEAFLDFVRPQAVRCFQGQAVAPEENPEEGGKDRTQQH